jgi:phosphatidylcholine synthase
MTDKFKALSVHLFTATGALLALWALMLIVEGDAQLSLILLAIAALIDSVDGTLARRVNVSKHIPQIDGALLDNIVDYLTWVFLPVVWAYYFLDLPFLAGAAVLICSLFGFSHKQAKTDANFFRGFPSYWNFVVFYLYVLSATPLITTMVMVLLAALVLAPINFVYPSLTEQWRRLTLLLSVPYSLMIIFMLIWLDETPLWFTVLSFYYPVYYIIISWLLTARQTRKF